MAEESGSPTQRPVADSGRSETEEERADRNLSDLLQELRVALPGVQVLFAFLLTVPFTNRFADISGFQQKLYFGVLISVALATVLLVAPTAGHRILFRQQQKEYIVTLSNRLALVGLFLLAVSMCGAIALISDFLFGSTTAIISTVLMAAAFIGFWFTGPIIRRAKLPPR
jgi:MFS family permease